MPTVTDDLIDLYTSADGLGLAQHVRQGDVTPVELVEVAATLIDGVDPQLNAVIHRLYDMARAGAKTVRHDAPFAGVPYLAKELYSMWEGAPLSNGMAWLKDAVAPTDNAVTRKLRAAGFLLVGKSNAPENGWSLTTEPALYGVTNNPWAPGVTPGGSSGGSAAAVAARLVPVAEASDAFGSIRVPASLCGVVGLKPSRGRLTLSPIADVWYGCANYLCVTRSVRDTAAYLDAVAGNLPGEPYQPARPDRSWLALSGEAPRGLRIGFTVTPPDGGPATDPQIAAAVRDVAAFLESQGHWVEEHDLSFDANEAWLRYARMTTVQVAHIFAWLEQVVGRPVEQGDLEAVTWATIQRGRSLSGLDHIYDIDAVRNAGIAIAGQTAAYDLYITPTLTQPARPFGYMDMSEPDLDLYNSKMGDAVFNFPFNLSGLPAMSVPTHMSTQGQPIGVQLVGRHADEATVLQAGALLEAHYRWASRRPPISA